MLKTRKKWISILLTLAMLVGLMVPFAGTAGAVGTVYTTLSAPSVEDDSTVALGSFQIEMDPGYISGSENSPDHIAWVELPSDYEIYNMTVSSGSSTIDVDFSQDEVTGTVYDSNNSKTATIKLDNFTENGFKVSLYKGTSDTGISGQKVRIVFDFTASGAVKVPAGVSGDIKAKITNVKGQLVSGSVVIGTIAGGGLQVSAVDTNTFSDSGGPVKLRVEETVAGKLNSSDELKIKLPDGFVWGSYSDLKTVWGNLNKADVEITPDDDELKITLKDGGTKSTERSAIEFTAQIDVDDPSDAKTGDVVAKLLGDYTVSPSEITVGTYGDYEATIEAEDPGVIAYAGMNDQDVSDIKIKESLAGSLIPGRTITLTLPEYARWVRVDDEYVNPDGLHSEIAKDKMLDSDGIEIDYAGLQGTDDRTLKLKLDGDPTSDSEAELSIEKLGVALKGGVTGDLKVEVGGSQGLTGELTIAKVVAPVTATAEKTNVQIGKSAQAAGKIVITEAAAGAIDSDGKLTLTLPKDLEFDGTPDVQVTSGDLEVSDVNVVDSDAGRNDVLEIEFKDDSTEASTIEISDINYNINRVLGEGDVVVKIGGSAVVETDSQGYYDESGNVTNDDPFWTGTDYAAKVVNAVCVTPAPGEAKYAASFVIGSTTYTVNGVDNTMDVAPYIKDGRTYLPVRYLAYALGVSEENVYWDAVNQTVTLLKGTTAVQLTVGSNVIKVNGISLTMDVAPEIKDGRTMLPARFVAQAFGYTVGYDEANQTVTLD